MSFRLARPGALAGLDPPGTAGWVEQADRWSRIASGHRLEVWREPRSGPWRWSCAGSVASRPCRTREDAMRRAMRAAALGRPPVG